jgi:NAD(P) transhydrogenase subunit beta
MNTTTHLRYLGTAICFVLGRHLMNSPATARRGNQLSAVGMAVAIALTVVVLVDERTITATAAAVLTFGVLTGVAGLVARGA